MLRALSLAVFCLVAAGCGGADPCTGSPCPQDLHPSTSQYQECRDRHQREASNKCYQQNFNYEVCVQQSTVCTEGKPDLSKTLSAIGTNCTTAQDSLVCCALGLTTCK